MPSQSDICQVKLRASDVNRAATRWLAKRAERINRQANLAANTRVLALAGKRRLFGLLPPLSAERLEEVRQQAYDMAHDDLTLTGGYWEDVITGLQKATALQINTSIFDEVSIGQDIANILDVELSRSSLDAAASS